MNILYLSERDPRDTHFGGAQRTNFIWSALRKRGNVYCLFFTDKNETQKISSQIWCVKKKYRISKLQYLFYRIEQRLFNPLHVLPLWPFRTNLEKTVEEIFPGVKFDAVVCRYLFDVAEMHLWKYPKVYVDIDDHPLEMYNTVKCLNVKPWMRPLGRFVIKCQMRYLEKKITGGWISNPEQTRLLYTDNKIVPLKNIALTPSKDYDVSAQRKPLLITVGAMNYYPNYQGVDKFLNEVWPEVNSIYPHLEFAIIGKGTPLEYIEKWEKIPNVKLMGFVKDLESVYETCLASVVPVYAGGGTCIKTLESLAYSRICLASSFGARGLENDMKNGQIGVYSYNSVSDFLKIIAEKVLCSDIRIQNETSARGFIKSNHSFEAFEKTVLSVLND